MARKNKKPRPASEPDLAAPGLDGFGEDARMLAECFAESITAKSWRIGDERMTASNAMLGFGYMMNCNARARQALLRLPASEARDEALATLDCADDHARTGWIDAAWTYELLTRGYTFTVDGKVRPEGPEAVFVVRFIEGPAAPRPEALLTLLCRARRKEWLSNQ